VLCQRRENRAGSLGVQRVNTAWYNAQFSAHFVHYGVNCGKQIPRSKAKAFTKKVSLVDYRMYTELKKQGSLIQAPVKKAYLCISCAIHKRKIAQRAKTDRKG
jgi:ribosomal protein S26